jgi:hypothetical protein
MSLPVGMRCPRNTSATKLFGPPLLYFGPHRGMPSSKRHTASGKIMIAGQLALIVAAVFAGRGSLRQHRRTARAVRARRPIFAHRMEARIQTRLRDASAARGGGVSLGAIGVLADRRLAVATRSSRPGLELAIYPPRHHADQHQAKSADPAIADHDIRKLIEKWRHCMVFAPRSALLQHCCFCGRRCASSKPLCLERALRLKGRPAKASPKVGFKPMHFRPTPLQRLHKASSADWEEGVAIRLTSISPTMIESSHLSPSSATALRSSRRISRVCLPAPTKLILEGLTKMPGFLGLDLGDCDAVQAEVNQVTSVCS